MSDGTRPHLSEIAGRKGDGIFSQKELVMSHLDYLKGLTTGRKETERNELCDQLDRGLVSRWLE